MDTRGAIPNPVRILSHRRRRLAGTRSSVNGFTVNGVLYTRALRCLTTLVDTSACCHTDADVIGTMSVPVRSDGAA